MRNLWVILACLFLLACTPVVQQTPAKTACNPPYHEYTPEDCCLDSNDDGVCDRDQNATIAPIVINKTPESTGPSTPDERTIMSDTLIKFRKNVTSYSYAVGKMHYEVRGPLVHVLYDHVEPLGFKLNGTIPAYITDVFVDRTAREAVGYCDPRSETTIMGKSNVDRSVCRDLIDVPLKLQYEKYSPYLPEDWLTRFSHALPMNIQDNDQYVKEPTGWKAVNPVLTFQEGKDEVILKLESKSGLPIRIQINHPVDTERMEYTWFIQDAVKPADVLYQPFHK